MLNLFKKHKTWYDITLGQFNRLSKLGVNPSVYDVIDIVYGIDSKKLPISELSKYPVNFLNSAVPKASIKSTYKLNGTKYSAMFDITRLTAGQFIDFRNYSANGAAKLEDILSVCMIPKGKSYNQGYDILKVKNDILSLPLPDAQAISFFFLNQSYVLFEAIQYSLMDQAKKMKSPTLSKILTQVQEAQSAILTSCQ